MVNKELPTLAPETLNAGLAAGRVVALSRDNWAGLEAGFQVEEEVPTGMRGSILLIRIPGVEPPGWGLVEEPEAEVRVVRPMPGEAEARALIADRLAAYERMWDG